MSAQRREQNGRACRSEGAPQVGHFGIDINPSEGGFFAVSLILYQIPPYIQSLLTQFQESGQPAPLFHPATLIAATVYQADNELVFPVPQASLRFCH